MTTETVIRRDDAQTSIDAARRILPHRSDLQAEIYEFIARRPGGCTAGEVERHDQFRHCGYSSVRKRCGELVKAGYLRVDGRRDGMQVLFAVPLGVLADELERKRKGLLFR